MQSYLALMGSNTVRGSSVIIFHKVLVFLTSAFLRNVTPRSWRVIAIMPSLVENCDITQFYYTDGF
jgi:hypothetical protein